jgi:hypothetical protein
MKKKEVIIRIFLVTAILAIALVVIGQNNNALEHKKQLIERFEKTIKNKEPKFKGGRTGGWDELSSMLQSNVSWKFGEAYVNATVFDYYSESDAAMYFRVNYTENNSSVLRSHGTKLTNLGDEAWLIITDNYNKKDGSTQIMLRKGSIHILVRATSPILAKRFARYLVREIEKRDRGEP